MKRNFRRLFGFILMVFTIIGFLVVFVYHQEVEDYILLRSFKPTKQIQVISENVTLTDRGEKLLFLGRPVVVTDLTIFNEKCHIEEFSIILGCFVDNKDIYIFDIVDKRLNGIEEVTAAHEMLHNAYSRLSKEEKAKVDTLVVDAYKNIGDRRIRDTITSYEKVDPSSVPNELHSILGTEIGDLPKELEDYYSQYFYDRSNVVKYATGYSSEFTTRENRVESIDKNLKPLGKRIDANKQQIKDLASEISSKNKQLDKLLKNNDISMYNILVPTFNSLVNSHNGLVSQVKADISEYNQLVEERNNLAVEVDTLIKAIDSTPEKIK